MPVTVKHSRGQFTFYDNGYRIDGPIDYVEAWDCQGRKIMDTTPKERGSWTSNPCISKYVFKELYPQSNQKETDFQSNYGNYGSDSYSSGYSSGWDKLADGVRKGSHIYDPAYPNITFQAGLSRVHGEFLRAKACLGGRTGYILYGGIGRDYLFDAKNEDYIGNDAKTTCWHVGLGYYGGDLNGETATGEFAFMMDYAQTPLVKNGSLNLWLEGTWYFGLEGRLGAFGGIGYSMGDFSEEAEKPIFNFIFEIGIAYRIF